METITKEKKYMKVTKTQIAHLFRVVKVTGDLLPLPLFLLRRSLIAARIIFLSSKSFDSSSCDAKKKKKKRHKFKQRGHSSQNPKWHCFIYACTPNMSWDEYKDK